MRRLLPLVLALALSLGAAQAQGLFVMGESAGRFGAQEQTLSLRLGYTYTLGNLSLTPSLYLRGCLSGCQEAFYGLDLDLSVSDSGVGLSLDSRGVWWRVWAVWRLP